MYIRKWSKNAFRDRFTSCHHSRSLSSWEKFSRLLALLRRAKWIYSLKRRLKFYLWSTLPKRWSSLSGLKNRRLLMTIVEFPRQKEAAISPNIINRPSTWIQSIRCCTMRNNLNSVIDKNLNNFQGGSRGKTALPISRCLLHRLLKKIPRCFLQSLSLNLPKRRVWLTDKNKIWAAQRITLW